MPDAAQPTSPAPRAELLYYFCRLQLPDVNLPPARCRHHLERTYQLYLKKLDAPISFGPRKHQGSDEVYYTTVRDGRFVRIEDWKRWGK